MKCPSTSWALAFPHHKGVPPEEWIDDVLEGQRPWDVAYLFHNAAVTSLPTLDALIGHLQTWPYEDDRDDAALWLAVHATEWQLHEISIRSKQTDLVQRSASGSHAFNRAHRLALRIHAASGMPGAAVMESASDQGR